MLPPTKGAHFWVNSVEKEKEMVVCVYTTEDQPVILADDDDSDDDSDDDGNNNNRKPNSLLLCTQSLAPLKDFFTFQPVIMESCRQLNISERSEVRKKKLEQLSKLVPLDSVC